MSSYTQFPAEARVGRERQVYNSENVRQVGGCIPINDHTKRVLLVESSKRQGAWVLPKGGQEDDEDLTLCAERETYEEAGVRGVIIGQLGDGPFVDVDKYGNPKSHVWFFEMSVTEELSNWPEEDMRERRWFTFEDAMRPETDLKPYMRSALLLSSIAPSRTYP